MQPHLFGECVQKETAGVQICTRQATQLKEPSANRGDCIHSRDLNERLNKFYTSRATLWREPRLLLRCDTRRLQRRKSRSRVCRRWHARQRYIALFARRFRRFRGREFLKARIISQRIEHGIEPEQRGSEPR